MKPALRSHLLFAIFSIPTGRPTVEILNFEMVEAQQEKRNLEIRAQRAQIFKTNELAVLEGLSSQIFDRENRVYRVSGEQGIFEMTSSNLEARGKSQVTSPEGYRFESFDFLFVSAERKFKSSSPVRVFQDLGTRKSSVLLTGQGFELDLKKRHYLIPARVRAEQKLPNGQLFQVRSGEVLIDPELNRAIFQKNVNVQSQKMKVQGDKLEIFLKNTSEMPGSETLGLESFRMEAWKNPSGRSGEIVAELYEIQIRSLGIEMKVLPSGELGPAEAYGAVRAQTADGVQMKGERMRMIQDAHGHKIELSGGVQISAQNRLATCETAYFRPATGEVILKKIASLKNHEQSLHGEQIRFSTKNSEIWVEKARGALSKEDLGLR